MSDSIDPRRLFADYASGAISAEQLQALEAALREDAELRRDFIEYMNVDSALGDLAALSNAEAAEIEAANHEDELREQIVGDSVSPAPSVGEPASFYRLAVATGAIVATLLLATIVWVADPGANIDTPVATLQSRVDAVLLHDGKSYSDTDLVAGKYELKRGLLHLRFDGDVMVYVEAPTRFDAVSNRHVVLHRGRLSANVPPAGIGFTVETPEAKVIDLGTEFSVEVDSGTSEVHVFKGLVRVQPRAKNDGATGKPVDLRTSQAVKIESKAEKPVEIELATDRFIRTFDEPKLKYPRAIKRLSPVAYYRMPIRDRGLAAEPPQYSGVVLTGDGIRPPHAHGMFAGGSLRVQADSTGRGGRVDAPPPLDTGMLTVVVFVYAESLPEGGTIATNLTKDGGNFALTLDEHGVLRATVRTIDGGLTSCSGISALPLRTWRHVAVAADGRKLQLFENGQLVGSTDCAALAPASGATLWFGTGAHENALWDGRIDEVAFYDKALTSDDIAILYRVAREQP